GRAPGRRPGRGRLVCGLRSLATAPGRPRRRGARAGSGPPSGGRRRPRTRAADSADRRADVEAAVPETARGRGGAPMKHRWIELELLSPWHVSSGRGRGASADLTVVRSSGGLPYLPGRALRGLLREAVVRAE